MNLARHSKIIELMENKNVISIKELAEKLECTEMTVRRNLDELQKMNFVKREHGYAYLLSPAQSTDYYVEIQENSKEKKAIAAAAFTYLQPHASICLDSGTTVQELVDLIPDNFPLSVITPSLTAAMSLSGKKEVQVLLPGGFLHHSNRSLLLDDIAALQKYQVDLAFLSCRSFRIPGGTFEHSQTLTTTKRALASIATRRILLLDYSKWNVSSICSSVTLDHIDIIITDNKAPEESIQAAVDLGKEILIVNPETRQVETHINQVC
ncbi:MAG: DeoR/GlpR family DNA-binding transcription regulator [Lachnospiraceae bacterium]|nr:DeoR/GlpR family DNA-binding transcription regulator [Lachnospiraceae bacterium]